eukprot:8940494-Alexandrium_andersonii.AAC.1
MVLSALATTAHGGWLGDPGTPDNNPPKTAGSAGSAGNARSPGGATTPRLRRERPHRGGATAPLDPAPNGASGAPEAPVGPPPRGEAARSGGADASWGGALPTLPALPPVFGLVGGLGVALWRHGDVGRVETPAAPVAPCSGAVFASTRAHRDQACALLPSALAVTANRGRRQGEVGRVERPTGREKRLLNGSTRRPRRIGKLAGCGEPSLELLQSHSQRMQRFKRALS